ncbi:GDP-mannose mannosyl hydrolase [Corallincola spongiicola]|uniref:GDP-mannose mannosyl hydrolase n=1 Tax=Corallincola spongiicola TaxID=2520508 RepID=A0ABY1WKB0_9GAMM|nr:GDP-mannose mannosyl hydrolase [Corallincola spongiicola]TAA39599.1 GDP-mannose mannosyl hydrolase [Corallincola spongiicola]
MFLDSTTFKQVIGATPLVSIDLVVRDSDNNILLGKRANKPAQGYWFVPGGRIRKSEAISCALQRLLLQELELDLGEIGSRFFGVYEHFYEDCMFGAQPDTHYVVLAFEISLQGHPKSLPCEQHSEYRWFSEGELLADPVVHTHTKWYLEMNARADVPLSGALRSE